jgi:putative transposase
VWALLRRRGQHVKKQPVQRLWKRATLPVRTMTRQRRSARPARVPVQATPPDQVWTGDVMHDPGLNGTPVTVFTVMEEFTREGLAIKVATSWPSPRVRAILEPLVVTPGAPQCIRRANGPECIARAIRGGLAPPQLRTLSIAPGGPWRNGDGERFTGPVRDDCLHRYVVHCVAEARVMLAASRRQDKEERPQSSLGYRTPAACKRDWLAQPSSSVGREPFHWPKLLGAGHSPVASKAAFSGRTPEKR